MRNRQMQAAVAWVCVFMLLFSGCGRSNRGPEVPAEPVTEQTQEAGNPSPMVSPPEPVSEATPEPTPDPTPDPTPPLTPEPTPTPTPTPEPTLTVDPISKLLPDIFAFLYHPQSYTRDGGHGRKMSCNGSHPGASFEGVKEELLALLAEEQYQLELADSWVNPHYSGIEMFDFFYRYTGTAEEMETLTDKYEEHEFHVMLTMTYYPEYDYFKLSMYYCDQFDVEDPGKRTAWDIEHDGEGGLLTTLPETGTDSGSDFWEKCSACHGSGDCTHCGGDDEVRKFQAGLGWVEQDCTFCSSGRCRSCGGDGRK